MQLGSWISIGVALTFAAVAPACDKGNGGRLTGVQGAEDASSQLNDFMCECLEGQEQDAVCEDEGLLDAVDYDCFERVLDQHPAERSKMQCYVDASYGLLECLEASGCPDFTVVEAEPVPAPDSGGNTSEDQTNDGSEDDGADNEPSPGDRCLDTFELDIEGCPEFSAAFEDQLEDECFEDIEVEIEGCDAETEDCG